MIGEQAIRRCGRATTDQGTEDGDVGFKVGGFAKAPCQQQGLRRIVVFDAFESFFLLFGARGSFAGRQLHEVHQFLRPGFFSDSYQREVTPGSFPAVNSFDDYIEFVGDLRDEDHVGTGSQTSAHGQPAGAVAKQLHQHNAVRGIGVGVEAVDRLGGNLAGGVEADRFIRTGHVVFAGFWHGDDIQSSLAKVMGSQLTLSIADNNQRVKIVAVVTVDGFLRAVNRTLGTGHLFGNVPAGAKDGAAPGQDARKHVAFQKVHLAVLDQTNVSIPKTKHFHIVAVCNSLAKSANGCVDTWAVTACCN